VLTVLTLLMVRRFSAAELILIIRVPARPSRAKVISMPMVRRTTQAACERTWRRPRIALLKALGEFGFVLPKAEANKL
jgi:hypothetical protein